MANVTIWTGITAKQIADGLGIKPSEVLKKLVARGKFATLNEPLDPHLAADAARDLGASVKFTAGSE